MSALQHERIAAACRTFRIGRRVIIFPTVDSTNNAAWEFAKSADNDGLCILAEHQTAGRGRRGNEWFGGNQQSILCSILLIEPPISAETLTLLAAVAVAQAVEQTCCLQTEIKWPNDVLIEGKKVCGILVEKKAIQGRQTLVLGFGINCNQTQQEFDQNNLAASAASLCQFTTQPIDRTELLIAVLKSLNERVERSKQSGDFHDRLIYEWMQRCRLIGRMLTVNSGGTVLTGACVGIDPANNLLLQMEGGVIKVCHASTSRIANAL